MLLFPHEFFVVQLQATLQNAEEVVRKRLCANLKTPNYNSHPRKAKQFSVPY